MTPLVHLRRQLRSARSPCCWRRAVAPPQARPQRRRGASSRRRSGPRSPRRPVAPIAPRCGWPSAPSPIVGQPLTTPAPGSLLDPPARPGLFAIDLFRRGTSSPRRGPTVCVPAAPHHDGEVWIVSRRTPSRAGRADRRARALSSRAGWPRVEPRLGRANGLVTGRTPLSRGRGSGMRSRRLPVPCGSGPAGRAARVAGARTPGSCPASRPLATRWTNDFRATAAHDRPMVSATLLRLGTHPGA
jgi:hypothetical protein